MTPNDLAALIHPAIAVAFVFPLIGIVTHFAWQTRQRRLQTASDSKSKIPPIVGPEHLKMGRWLTGAVVGVALIGLAYPTGDYILHNNLLSENPSQVVLLILLFVATIASLVLLYRAKPPLWRAVFATLSGMGVVLIGLQDLVFNREGFGAIFRRDNEWYVSHFYFGTIVTLLMIFSLAIVQDIYQDRKHRWRMVHVILNCLALLLFIGQGMTGARDLLEIPLSWQKPFIYQCDYVNLTCPSPAPASQSSPSASAT